MFATFQISEAGLDNVAVRSTFKRTATGCLTCRARKKKCDETRPRCLRCQRWPSLHCAWPCDAGNACPVPSILRHPEGWELASRAPAAALHFEAIHTLPFEGPLFSPVRLYVDSPLWSVLQPAYAACGAATLWKQDARWVSASVFFYSQAVKNLSAVLAESQHANLWHDEALFATINVLHVFELMKHETSPSKAIHLLAGWRLWRKYIAERAPMSYMGRLSLEHYVFQVTIQYLFSKPGDLNPAIASDVNTFLDVIHCAGEPYTGTALGLSHEVFRCVMRVSFLWKQKRQLDPTERTEVMAILETLRQWAPPSLHQFPAPSPHVPASGQALLIVAELYRTGCTILTIKLLNPPTSAWHPAIEESVKTGVSLLRTIRHSGFHQATCLIWPIIVIGVAATSTKDQEVCQEILQALVAEKGLHCFQPALSLLATAWLPEGMGHAGSRGLEVLYDDELLATIRT